MGHSWKFVFKYQIMKKLLLIDAYAMIYRAYYAFIRVPRMNSKGENTSAIFGFCVTLEDLLKKVQPTHVGVAFDPKGGTFRHEAYEAYKAQREETPEDIRRAVPIIKDILHAMRIPAMECPGFEADDVIGTLAKQAEQRGYEVYMATPDKDYGQLVSEHITMYRSRHTGGFEPMGPKEVCEKYGLSHQDQVIDLLGLMGDASDNIPGCTGVGEKTAVKLLQEWGSIDNMLEHADEIKGALGQKIRDQKEQIRFSRFLATIRTDVPIDLPEDELVVKEKNWDELTPLYEDLEFSSLLRTPRPPKGGGVATTATAKVTKAKPKDTGMADLFGDMSEGSEGVVPQAPGVLSPEDKQKAELIQYMLNPEVRFNPANAPTEDMLRENEALWKLYTEVEQPLTSILRRMEQAGVRFDVALLKQAEVELTAELNTIEQDIYAQLPPPWGGDGGGLNVSSPKQVGEVLFDVLKLDPKAKKGKNGAYSTSEDVLLALKEKHPVVGKILEYRELKKLISTYIATLPTYIKEDGKIHAQYNQTVTATGRLSCSNPNLQNLPIRTERGKLIRQAVIPDEGCLFLSADYSQIELRLLAHLSGDENLTLAFLSGQDVHAATAARIFHKRIEDVTKDERRRAKTANFGIIYGISAFGLSQQLECSRQEAKALIDGYFAAFPRVIAYIEEQKERARQNGFAETLFGRRRYLPDINSHNGTVRAFAERNAVNAPIQGTAADIIKKAMVAIDRRLTEEGLKAQMTMQVHDELNFNVPVNEVERVREIVVGEMANVAHLSVPLIAECGVGANWLVAH